MTKQSRGCRSGVQRSLKEMPDVPRVYLRHHPAPDVDDFQSRTVDPYRYSQMGPRSSSYASEQSESAVIKHGGLSPVSLTSNLSEVDTVHQTSSTSRSMSSASSWTDDGFEQEVAERVQQLFDDVDAYLYEGVPLPGELKNLQKECQHWVKNFPHFRVRGDKVNATNDTASKILVPRTRMSSGKPFMIMATQKDGLIAKSLPASHRTGSGKQTGKSLGSKRASSGVSSDRIRFLVKGVSLKPLTVAEDESDESTHDLSAHEEVFDADGEYEELIAVDSSDDAMSGSKSSVLAEDREVVSFALQALQRSILDRLTEELWKEVVGPLRHFANHRVDNIFDGIAFESRMTRPSVSSSRPATSGSLSLPRFPSTPQTSQGSTDLQNVLTISSKTLVDRCAEKGNSRNGALGSASTGTYGGSKSTSPQRCFPRSCRGRLAPLDPSNRSPPPPSPLRPQGYASVRGKRYSIPPPSSPLSWGRHLRLPPIEAVAQSMEAGDLPEYPVSKNSRIRDRVSSASTVTDFWLQSGILNRFPESSSNRIPSSLGLQGSLEKRNAISSRQRKSMN